MRSSSYAQKQAHHCYRTRQNLVFQSNSQSFYRPDLTWCKQGSLAIVVNRRVSKFTIDRIFHAPNKTEGGRSERYCIMVIINRLINLPRTICSEIWLWTPSRPRGGGEFTSRFPLSFSVHSRSFNDDSAHHISISLFSTASLTELSGESKEQQIYLVFPSPTNMASWAA